MYSKCFVKVNLIQENPFSGLLVHYSNVKNFSGRLRRITCLLSCVLSRSRWNSTPYTCSSKSTGTAFQSEKKKKKRCRNIRKRGDAIVVHSRRSFAPHQGTSCNAHRAAVEAPREWGKPERAADGFRHRSVTGEHRPRTFNVRSAPITFQPHAHARPLRCLRFVLCFDDLGKQHEHVTREDGHVTIAPCCRRGELRKVSSSLLLTAEPVSAGSRDMKRVLFSTPFNRYSSGVPWARSSMSSSR